MSDYKPIEKLDYTFYKWIHTSKDLTDLCYVGSTANMVSRKALHKSICNNPNNKSYTNLLYTTMRENGGFNDFKMVILGTAEQITKREAQAIEEQYRISEQATLNSCRCYITEEQKAERQAEYQKQYRQDNPETIAEYTKQYYQNNKTKIAEYQKQYRQDNPETTAEYYQNNKTEILDHNKQYKQDNKAKIAEQKKQYYLKNKARIAEHQKQYYLKNKTTISG